MGKAWLNKETQKISADGELFDVEKSITRKDFGTAIEILKQSKSIDVDMVQKKILEIEKESLEYNEISLYTQRLLEGKSLVGVDYKNTTEKKVLKNTENILMAEAQNNQYNIEQKFAHVDNTFARNGILAPTFKDLIETGFVSGSISTFDSSADIPETLINAVKVAETADRLGRLNVYTNNEQERFYKNIIVLKKISGLDNYQAIKQAKNFEINYDKEMLTAANKNRTAMFGNLEEEFDEIKATNIGEVRLYASQLLDIYVANGIAPSKAEQKVIEDINGSISIVDNHAYFKRDIEAFRSIGGTMEIKTIKEYIVKSKLPEEDPNDFFFRHNGGGQFEIRREVDISTVYDNEGQPLIFYSKDLKKLDEERILKRNEEEQKKIQEQQEKKQLRLKKSQETQRVGRG